MDTYLIHGARCELFGILYVTHLCCRADYMLLSLSVAAVIWILSFVQLNRKRICSSLFLYRPLSLSRFLSSSLPCLALTTAPFTIGMMTKVVIPLNGPYWFISVAVHHRPKYLQQKTMISLTCNQYSISFVLSLQAE